jgi:hypothetical protein
MFRYQLNGYGATSRVPEKLDPSYLQLLNQGG